MKLRALKYLKNNLPATFGSCYRGMGTLTKIDLNKIIYDTFDYLLNPKYLGISPNDIKIKLNSKDIDLIKSTETIGKIIKREYNTENYINIKQYNKIINGK